MKLRVSDDFYLLLESDIKLNIMNNVITNMKQIMEIFCGGISWKSLSSASAIQE